jgi:hypothetical protein
MVCFVQDVSTFEGWNVFTLKAGAAATEIGTYQAVPPPLPVIRCPSFNSACDFWTPTWSTGQTAPRAGFQNPHGIVCREDNGR